MSITVKPMHPDFVTEISGVDLSRPLTPAITDYWLTNAIARASQTMAQCSREFGAANKMAAE